MPNYVGFESRQYVERLIDMSKKYGDKYKKKHLKLFKRFIPLICDCNE